MAKVELSRGKTDCSPATHNRRLTPRRSDQCGSSALDIESHCRERNSAGLLPTWIDRAIERRNAIVAAWVIEQRIDADVVCSRDPWPLGREKPSLLPLLGHDLEQTLRGARRPRCNLGKRMTKGSRLPARGFVISQSIGETGARTASITWKRLATERPSLHSKMFVMPAPTTRAG